MVEIKEELLPETFVYSKVMREVEKELLLIAYCKCKGNQSEMAKYLGISRSKVMDRMKLYGIDVNKRREGW
ncbi:MAG: helix-turn-helix domain-containing protein [Wohlfahrtiimonas sp.]